MQLKVMEIEKVQMCLDIVDCARMQMVVNSVNVQVGTNLVIFTCARTQMVVNYAW